MDDSVGCAKFQMAWLWPDSLEASLSQTSSDQEDYIKGNCDCHPKTINVISQKQELVLDVLRKIEDETVKQELFEVFKKFVHKP